ncbi:MAG: formate dehydrogenase accessory sulfurtransferase FdhD [Caulobacteraceae bacterium]
MKGQARDQPTRIWRFGRTAEGERRIPEETPVAIVHDGSTTAVMMASPSDIEDFAIGFSLTEGIVGGLAEVRDLQIVATPLGIEARLWLAGDRADALAKRRRRLVGPTGCGLCGIESLAEATGATVTVKGHARFTPDEVSRAMASVAARQPLGGETRATHAAALWRLGQGLIAVREDVGRHNALDKLAGALARGGESGDGLVLLTSRVSVEMVQKAAMIGAPVLAAVSAPTALAVRLAEEAGLTLIGVARADGFEVFTHPERLRWP